MRPLLSQSTWLVSIPATITYNLLVNYLVRQNTMEQGLPNTPDQLTQSALMNYLQKFLDIADFKRIENGKALLQLIRNHPQHSRIKVAVRKVIGLFFCELPISRVCALQFLKQAVETGCWAVVQAVQKSILSHMAQVIEYRPAIRNIQRGSSYFISNLNKNTTDDEVINLIKLSSTFFRMVHECIYVWGAIYFPGSQFDRVRKKMQKKCDFPVFPTQFKFYNEKKIQNFKNNCKQLIERMNRKVKQQNDTNSIISRNSSSSIGKMKRQDSKKQNQGRANSVITLNNKNQGLRDGLKMFPIRNDKLLPMTHIQHQQQENTIKSARQSKSKKYKKYSQKEKRQLQRKKIFDSQKQEDHVSQNNSSKLRKKNSFNEMPLGVIAEVSEHPTPAANSKNNSPSPKFINKQISNSPQMIDNKMNKNSSLKPIFKTITEDEDSDGGRFSKAESNYEDSQVFGSQSEELSPRTEYSLKQQPLLKPKKQISQQLITNFRDSPQKQTENNALQQKIYKPNKNNREFQTPKPVKNQYSKESKGKSLIKPLEKQKMDQANKLKDHFSKDKKSKRGDSSNRKKFISSEQQQTRNEGQKQLKKQDNLINAKRKQITGESAISEVQIKKESPIEKQQKLNLGNVVKMNKPQKIKGSQSSRSVYEAAIEKQQQKNNVVVNDQKSQKRKKENTQENTPVIQKQQLKSKIPNIIQKDNDFSNNIKSQRSTQNKIDKKVSQNKIKQQTKIKQKDRLKNNKDIDRQSNKPKNQFDLTAVQQMPDITQISKQIKSIENKRQSQTQFSIHAADDIPEIPNVRTIDKLKKSIVKIEAEESDQSIHQKDTRNNQKPQRLQLQYHKHGNNQKKIQSARSNYFKTKLKNVNEVNLLITPVKNNELTNIQDIQNSLLKTQQLQSTIKQQITEQFNHLKAALITKQEDSLIEGLSHLKQQMFTNRQIDHYAIECSTQTQIRHYSKGKFQRKRKYLLNDQLTEDQIKLSQTLISAKTEKNYGVSPSLNQTQQFSNISNKIGKTTETLKSTMRSVSNEKVGQQQLKPNTLLYALFRKKSLKL